MKLNTGSYLILC